MHRILAVGEIHRLGYVKPEHSNEGLRTVRVPKHTKWNPYHNKRIDELFSHEILAAEN
jgi:hypothetical protein